MTDVEVPDTPKKVAGTGPDGKKGDGGRVRGADLEEYRDCRSDDETEEEGVGRYRMIGEEGKDHPGHQEEGGTDPGEEDDKEREIDLLDVRPERPEVASCEVFRRGWIDAADGPDQSFVYPGDESDRSP